MAGATVAGATLADVTVAGATVADATVARPSPFPDSGRAADAVRRLVIFFR